MDRDIATAIGRLDRYLFRIKRALKNRELSVALSDTADFPKLRAGSVSRISAQNGRVVSLSSQFTEILVAAGLWKARNHQGRGIGRGAKREGTYVSFHSLRHTAVSLLKDAGIPDPVVMALVGHALAHRDRIMIFFSW
jgi:integrase